MRRSLLSFGLVALVIAATASAQFKETPPAPYPVAEARQRIGTLLEKTNADNRQQTVTTLSGMLTWYRDPLDDELIAAWHGEGRTNLPDVIIALADERIATEIVEYSWHEQRQATFNLTYAPMFENLMARYADSARPFLRDLTGITGNVAPELSPSEVEAVCRILIDMPDTGVWRATGRQILPRYRLVALSLLSQDMHSSDNQRVGRAQFWLSEIAIRGGLPAAAPPGNPAPLAAPAGAVAGTNGMSAPSVLSKVDPEYSEVARKLRASGSVRLSIVVDPSGIARDLRVIRSLGFGLDEKAMEAVQKWRFNPGTNRGVPVNVRAQIEVNFRLLKDGPGRNLWYTSRMTFDTEDDFVPPQVTDGKMPPADKEASDESVLLEFTVDLNGAVKNSFKVVHGTEAAGQLLAQSLVTWKFRPATRAGQRVEATGSVLFLKGLGDVGSQFPVLQPGTK